MGIETDDQHADERRERAISEFQLDSDDQPNEYRGEITFDEDSSTDELLENLQKIKSNKP
ncbi:hypothetical protein GS429_07455 [Natronorubrum sp. JWXQ-INN-674]|uniref:DUF5786 domain-containing protein n=1 Tax=Natronorubrum halalkaliphilum TaxID=2691917 RepID=A0A6B0VL40_9EURY|nr:DUF5786 family protein [Natronorubrum halalkaliphilum]MXV61893.1 hypothetical protein [Natronorubrum halalkaliphilum]